VNKWSKIVTPPAVVKGYESFASGRGYIWSRTLPLIKKHILLGSGPDTFLLEFPQQDYVGLTNHGYTHMLISKPHCLYMQMAVNTGLISLIAFLAFYAMYFFTSLRLYIRGRFNSYYARVGVAIMIGTAVYMVTGLTNDSSITTAPVFWCLMGLGIVANAKAKPLIMKEIEEAKAKKQEKRMAKQAPAIQ
jgi:O-antigen ligase